MKRLALVGAALFAIVGVFSPKPVLADNSSDVVTPILESVDAYLKAPPGWHQRSICVGNKSMDKAWCLYFAWPY